MIRFSVLVKRYCHTLGKITEKALDTWMCPSAQRDVFPGPSEVFYIISIITLTDLNPVKSLRYPRRDKMVEKERHSTIGDCFATGKTKLQCSADDE